MYKKESGHQFGMYMINPYKSQSQFFYSLCKRNIWKIIGVYSFQINSTGIAQPFPPACHLAPCINIMMTSCRRDQPYKSSTSLKAPEGNGIADVVNLFANLFWGLGWAPAQKKDENGLFPTKREHFRHPDICNILSSCVFVKSLFYQALDSF